MRSRLILTVAVAAILGSCSRHESVLTGSYGARVVAGQVVMASEGADSTPAGVEVTVVGTGMSTTLAADGRFTFAGVPEDAELTFSRPDGIDARLRVTSTSSPLVIEVSGNSAKSSSRRRVVSPKDPKEVEGVIVSVSADALTVLDSHKNEVKIAITSSTVIRKGDQTVAPADLKQGDRVHVKTTMVQDVLTATQIVVQQADSDDDHGRQQQLEGLVVSASSDSVTVRDAHGVEVKVAVDSSTVIRKGGQILTAADLKKDDRVHVKMVMKNNVLTATEIIVQNQRRA